MVPQEMIIGVKQLLQKINSNQLNGLQDEEIIWHLNAEQLRFIKQRMNPKSNDKRDGFQATEKRYDDLQELVTSINLTSYVRDTISVFANLPSNYMYLINDRSLVNDLCNTTFSSITQTTDTYYYAVVPMNKGYAFYNRAVLKNDTVNTMLNVPSISILSNQLVAETTMFILINFILEHVTGLDIYWENWNGNYYPNSFVFVSTTDFHNITWSASSTVYTYVTQSTPLVHYNVPNGTEVPNRLTKTEDIFTLLQSSFGTTFWHAPISSLTKSQIVVYHKQKFILQNVRIDYIRKPRPIDLTLNQSCELSDPAQEEMIDNVSKRLAGVIQSPVYPQLSNENLKIE